jgi:hypothetical protein
MGGWVKIHRRILEWQWATSPSHMALFLQILLRANYRLTVWRREVVLPGQLLTGRKQLAAWSGLTESQVRTVLKDLIFSQEISQVSTKKYSIITIAKWEEYQELADNLANRSPTDRQQIATSKNYNNSKKEKNVLNTFTETQGVREAYRKSYAERYGMSPTWAAAQNAMAKRLVTAIGAAEAEKIAGEYPFFNDPWHIKQKHPFKLLVAQLDKVRVELANPNRMLDAMRAEKQISDQASRQNAQESLYSGFAKGASCLVDQT